MRTITSFNQMTAALLVGWGLVACASPGASMRPSVDGARTDPLHDEGVPAAGASSGRRQSPEEEAKRRVSLPPRSFALPIEFEGDWGAANGDALLIRFMPLYKLPLGEEWELANLDLITLADAPGLPSVPGVPGSGGESEFGLSDWVHAFFVEKQGQSPLILGLGAALSVPTATADVLGTGKWAAGPSLRATYLGEDWTLGVVAIQRWSFAGDADRADVNQLLARGAIRRKLPDDWFFVSAPIITSNWEAPSDQRWLVPLGGGFGRLFDVGDHRWAASLQAYYNAIRPDGAPDWSLRISVIPAIPLPR